MLLNWSWAPEINPTRGTKPHFFFDVILAHWMLNTFTHIDQPCSLFRLTKYTDWKNLPREHKVQANTFKKLSDRFNVQTLVRAIGVKKICNSHFRL